MDTGNQFLVGSRPDGTVAIMRAQKGWPPLELTREQAINLAAWLVANADPGREEFDQVLRSLLS